MKIRLKSLIFSYLVFLNVGLANGKEPRPIILGDGETPLDYIISIQYPSIGRIKMVQYLTSGHIRQNKPRYEKFNWKVCESKHFRLHTYDTYNQNLADWYLEKLEQAYEKNSKRFKANTFDKKISVTIYNSRRGFNETNLFFGLMPEGLEGFTETVKRKRLTVYFRGSKKHLEELLEHELTHSFEFEVLNEETHEREDIPLWFIEAVEEHNSRSWDSDYDMTMRAAYLANAIAPLTEKEFPRMFQVYIEGHLASNFIYDTCKNGPASDPIKEILYKSRSSPFENAVKDTCGFSLKDLDRKFQGYLEKRYGHLKGKEEVTAKSSELTDGLLSGASDYFFTSQKWILGRETFFLHFKNGGEIINKKNR